MISDSIHRPVLLKEVIKFLDPKPGEFIIDGTVNGGGHAEEIIKRISPGGKFLGIDLDIDRIENLKKSFSAGKTTEEKVFKKLVRGNYADTKEILKNEKMGKADGLLLDLGFSSEQLEKSGRGFSFAPSAMNEPLLMTYDRDAKPARELLKELGEKELAKIIFEFSGEKFAMRIARAIKNAGRKKNIETVGDIAEAIAAAVPRNYERGRINPATRTFQALRIYANDELENLKKILETLESVLNPGARVVVVSFHSLEDKIVKNIFKRHKDGGQLEILTKKPVIAEGEEIIKNSRSRSAKLRAARII